MKVNLSVSSWGTSIYPVIFLILLLPIGVIWHKQNELLYLFDKFVVLQLAKSTCPFPSTSHIYSRSKHGADAELAVIWLHGLTGSGPKTFKKITSTLEKDVASRISWHFPTSIKKFTDWDNVGEVNSWFNIDKNAFSRNVSLDAVDKMKKEVKKVGMELVEFVECVREREGVRVVVGGTSQGGAVVWMMSEMVRDEDREWMDVVLENTWLVEGGRGNATVRNADIIYNEYDTVIPAWLVEQSIDSSSSIKSVTKIQNIDSKHSVVTEEHAQFLDKILSNKLNPESLK